MRDHLGLFEKPADRQHIRPSIVIVGLMIALFVVVLPFRNVPLTPLHSFVPTIDGIQLVDELVISVLLYAQASIFRSRALVVLASGYLLSALLLVPHALTFPDAFSPQGLLGAKVNTAAWLGLARRAMFPLSIVAYVLIKRMEAAQPPERKPSPIRPRRWAMIAVALAALATLTATLLHDWLPPLFVDSREGIAGNLMVGRILTGIPTIVAIVLLLRERKSVLDIWLLVAMCGWLCQFMPIEARFTVGFYYLFGNLLASNLIVMIALIVESARLYRRLALSTAAWQRERDNRLMSMDAVASAIAHEIGQPLAGVSLTTTAAMEFLRREPPDTERAALSLRDSQEAGRRAFDVVRSVRAMFSDGMGVRSRFNLNDLILETASLLQAELKADKVALKLHLDPDLPGIEANRVQIQRILVNLITNSLEAIRIADTSLRRILVSTKKIPGDYALLEVTDTGIGIPPDKLTEIFEPFVTTKERGTGLGLSLCRTIVEEHGGRMWAAVSKTQRATFSLQLPHLREVASAAAE